MQLKAEDLANPNLAKKNLNEKLYQSSEAFKHLESYCSQYQLTVNEATRKELEQEIFTNTKGLDFKAMQEKGLLVPNSSEYQNIQKLELPDSEKVALYHAYKTLAKKANIENLSIEVHNTENVILKAYDQEIKLNMKQKHLDGFVDATGKEIPIESPEELLHIGLLINWLRNPQHTR